jgi:histidine phosphotransfer protein HptB
MTLDFDPLPLAQLAKDLDVDTAKEIIQSFLAEAPGLVHDAQEARNAGRVEEFRRAVHTLKSIAANVGGARLSENAKAMELAAKEARLPPAPAVDELAAQLAALRPRLEAWNG